MALFDLLRSDGSSIPLFVALNAHEQSEPLQLTEGLHSVLHALTHDFFFVFFFCWF